MGGGTAKQETGSHIKANTWFDGESTGTADGARIRSASIKGTSLFGELGLRMEPTETSPWRVDIGITGHAGK